MIQYGEVSRVGGKNYHFLRYNSAHCTLEEAGRGCNWGDKGHPVDLIVILSPLSTWKELAHPPKAARSYSPQFQSAQPDHCSTHPLHFTLLQQPPVSTSFGPPKLLSSSIMYLEDMFKLVWHTYTEVESYTRNNIRIILTSSNKIQPGRGDKSTKKASQRQNNWEKKTKQGRTASGYTRQQSTRLTLLEASPPSALNPISLSDNISARSPYD